MEEPQEDPFRSKKEITRTFYGSSTSSPDAAKLKRK
jgi:hypothetical protein